MTSTVADRSYSGLDGRVETRFLNNSELIPLVIQSKEIQIDPPNWGNGNMAALLRLLLEHGALLLRGFRVQSLSDFRDFARITSSKLMEYSEPSTSRTRLSQNVYTTTEYPATENIPLHNEMSYSHIWPMRIWFHCVTPAERGGETPIGDSRNVFRLLDPIIRDRFTEKGVMYVRNYGGGMGLAWQTVFDTDRKDVLEERCRAARIEYEWLGGDRLRTRQVRQAVAQHPSTGEMVWFNQAHIHHVLNLQPDLREAILSMAEEEDYPLDINTFYGDGSPIEASVLEEIHRAYKEATTSFPWAKGDIMMLDNMLTAHGRNAFVGRRRIVVAMGDPSSDEETTTIPI